MPITLHTKNGKKIIVEDTSLGQGGEGVIYKVISSSYGGYCVKMYFDKCRTSEKQRKIEFMIANPPSDLKGINYVVCWPVEVVFQNNQFVGFVMPLAFSNSEDLYELCLPKNKLPMLWQQKYDRATGNGLLARMKLCTNLAASIHRVHSLNKYIFVDIKPQNILVTNDSKISLVDLDSIQIAQNNKILFSAAVSTPEYEPPESKAIKNRASSVLKESWDRFSMSIILYEILFGIHPYVASFSGRYQSCSTISEYIQNNLFVHGSNGKNYINALPPLHNNYYKIPTSLQQLFIRAFEGHPLQRPSAEEFGRTFYQIINGVTNNKPTTNPPSISTLPFTGGLTQSPNNLPPPISIVKYASIERRIKAHLIDIFMFTIFSIFISFSFWGLMAFTASKQMNIPNEIFYLSVTVTTIMSLYFYWIHPLLISWQATIGKKIIGIKVISKDGGKLNLFRAFIRQFMLLFITLLFICFLPIYWIFFSKKPTSHHNVIIQFVSDFFLSKDNQTPYDLLAKTVVIEE